MKHLIILTAFLPWCDASPAFVHPVALSKKPQRGDVIAPLPLLARKSPVQHQPLRRRGRRIDAGLPGEMSPSAVGLVVSSASSVLSWAQSAIVGVAGVLFGLSIINFLQGGVRGDRGSTPNQILGVPAEEATAEHVARLGKAEFMQLFHASACPTPGDLDGEYKARTLEIGVLHPITAIITHRIWGPGRWLGKGISFRSSEGYNVFFRGSRTNTPPPPPPPPPPSSPPSSSGWPDARSNEDGSAGDDRKIHIPGEVRRGRTFRFSQFEESVFDKGASSRLDYAKAGNNGPLFGGMRDEIRKVNSKLFVGLGYIQAFGGRYNSAPFLLEGPPVQAFSALDNEAK